MPETNNAVDTKQTFPLHKLKPTRPAAFRSRHHHGNRSKPCRAHRSPRRPAVARRPGDLLPLAQAPFAAGHHPHRRIPARASALELRGAQRPGRLRRAGQVPQQPAAWCACWSGSSSFCPSSITACYGVWIWLRGKSNIVYYPWAGNWLYVAQRYTGLIAFAYIAQHVIRQRFMGVSLPEHPYAAFPRCSTSWPIPGCWPSTLSP